MRILVTGAAGFIGYHLTKDLLEKNNVVVALDNFSSGKKDKSWRDLVNKYGKQLEVIENDCIYCPLPKNVSQIYHLAATIGTKDIVGKPYWVLINNISMIDNIINQFQDFHIKIVYASTVEAQMGLPNAPIPTPETAPVGWTEPFDTRWAYSISKFMGEELLASFSRDSRFKYSIARLSGAYGPRMCQDYMVKSFIKKVLGSEKELEIHSANDTRPLTYISDVVSGLEALMDCEEADREIVNIGNTRKIRVWYVINYLADLVKCEAELVAHNSKYPEQRQSDITKAGKLLKWKPKVGIEEGLKLTLDWYQNNE